MTPENFCNLKNLESSPKYLSHKNYRRVQMQQKVDQTYRSRLQTHKLWLHFFQQKLCVSSSLCTRASSVVYPVRVNLTSSVVSVDFLCRTNEGHTHKSTQLTHHNIKVTHCYFVSVWVYTAPLRTTVHQLKKKKQFFAIISVFTSAHATTAKA